MDRKIYPIQIATIKKKGVELIPDKTEFKTKNISSDKDIL